MKSICEVRSLLGSDVVLIPNEPLSKKPIPKGWPSLTLAAMSDESHLRLFERKGVNIGVLLGAASDNLCTIDCDTDEFLADLLRLNPPLQKTLQTRRVRGGNLWIRMKDNYPSRCSKLKHTENGRDEIGEWRANGSQTCIAGSVQDATKGETEPTDYRVVVNASPVEIAFDDIRWPEYALLPWTKDQHEDAYSELVTQFGPPFFAGEKGGISLNEYGYAGMLAMEHPVLFEPYEGRFYLYDESNGLWRPQVESSMLDLVSRDMQAYATKTNTESDLLPKRTAGRVRSILKHLEGITAKAGAFSRNGNVIHCSNGMLHLLDNGECELREFSRNAYSRNQVPLAFNSKAECPRFRNELLASALDPDDIDLLQRYCGALLLGGNAAQRILLLSGTPGGGKSTLLEVIEGIVGAENICELRTKLLHERFEIARFSGKTLLTGKDVSGNFLMQDGASALKKLVGGDAMDGERKNSNELIKTRGEYAVIITCNSRLRVKLDSDAGAWRRRLIILPYEKPKPDVPISEFAKKLLEQEGEGILRWMVEGAMRHKEELRAHGNFVLTKRQTDRVDALLSESDSLRFFLETRIERHQDADLWTREITDAYFDFCEEQCWQAWPLKSVERDLPNLMAEIYRSNKSDRVERDGKRERGYLNVRLKKEGVGS